MTYDRTYKIVIAEDEAVILKNLKQKIESISPFFEIAGCARNGEEALSIIGALKPDILFTDIRMPKMDGLDLIRKVREFSSDLQIAIVSGYNEFDYAREAIKLGVTEYLLKPVNIDLLKDTLLNMKKKLDLSTSYKEREILDSSIHGLCSCAELPYTIKNGRFFIFLICIGHMCTRIPSNIQLGFFHHVWEKVDWGQITRPYEKWWLIDENHPNQKCLILSLESDSQNPVEAAQMIKDKLSFYVNPLPINLCINDVFVPYPEIWQVTQKLRMLLDQCLVPGQSAVHTPSSSFQYKMPAAILDSNLQNKVLALLHQVNEALLRQEIFNQFKKWEQSNYTQRWIEKVLHQLISLFHRHCPSITEDEINRMEYELNDKLAVSPSLAHIYEDIWSILYSMLMSSNHTKNSMKDIMEKIEEYIKANYTSNLNIEEIARKFSFNPTYLSKVFKKYKHMTPSKYITELRITEAKRLIESHPELDIKQIGEIVGYEDQHYFSRIFKNLTNATPTEYREASMNNSYPTRP